MCLIGGTLIFDEADIELQAENILITDGGILQVHNRTCYTFIADLSLFVFQMLYIKWITNYMTFPKFVFSLVSIIEIISFLGGKVPQSMMTL